MSTAITPQQVIVNSDLYKNECERLKKVIDPTQLLIQLRKVQACGVEMDLNDGLNKACLNNSFVWKMTPQGAAFWTKLNHGY